MESEPVWVVAFIGEETEECKAQSDEFWNAAKSLNGMISFAAVNVSTPDGAALAESIPEADGCGSILIYPFGLEKEEAEPEQYTGELEKKAMEVLRFIWHG